MTSKLFPAADPGTFHRYPPANAGTFHLHLLSPSHPFIGTVVGSPQFAWTLQVVFNFAGIVLLNTIVLFNTDVHKHARE